MDTEDFAEYVRTVLELEIKWYENSKSAVESFKTLRDKISQAGVIVMMSGIVGNNTHRPLDINEFRAFAMVDDLVPLIFINSNDSVSGKLFSLLHEFAHICIGNNSLYNDRYSSGTRVSKAESVSNAVAAEILVPQVMFEKKWKEIDKFDDPIKTIDALTKYFSCGTTVIARKALDNGYIDYSVYRKLSQIAVNRYNEKRKRKKSKAVAETIIELRQAELIHGFSRAWSQAFTKEKLYTRTLLDLLIPIDLPLKIWLTKWGWVEVNQEVFLIDTNALLTPHLMYYPFDLAPSFWEQLEEKLKDGSVVLLDMVKNEITEGHDELSNWMKSLQGINIIDHRTPEIIEKYSRVLGAVQSNTCYKQSALAEWSRESVADPWLIATAAVRKLTIVTFEKEWWSVTQKSE